MRRAVIPVLALLLALWPAAAFANAEAETSATPPGDPKIAILEARVAELEAQNRAILELLRELRSDSDGHRSTPEAAAGRPAETSAGSQIVHAVMTSTTTPAATAVSSLQTPTGGGLKSDGPLLPKEIQVGSSTLGFYGFLRLDAIYDDSRPNHPQSPNFILSEDPRLGPPGDSQFNFHPRLTRLGMNYNGPQFGKVGGARLSGKIEIDFQAGGSESRELIRMRQGYLKVSWSEWSLLVGQTWDAFSPLFPTVNSDTLMWNTGNLGDRRPQVRFAYEPKEGPVTFVGGIGLTGAIDGKDLDGDGVRDGDDSSLPHFQARLGFRGARWNLGLWGHYGQEETTLPIAGETDFDSLSVGLDFKFGLSERVTFQGELWSGSNLSDVRGGIGQGINTATGQEIDSEGGWLELGVQLNKVYSIYGGATLDDPDDDDLAAGGRTENRSWYLVNRFRVGQPFLIGVDYLRWTTEYLGLEDGTDNRWNLYLVYNF